MKQARGVREPMMVGSAPVETLARVAERLGGGTFAVLAAAGSEHAPQRRTPGAVVGEDGDAEIQGWTVPVLGEA